MWILQYPACWFHQLEGPDTGDFEANNAAAFLLSTESSKTIFIAVKDDDLPEADETFTFNLKLQVNAPRLLHVIVYVCKGVPVTSFQFLCLFLFFADDSLTSSSHAPSSFFSGALSFLSTKSHCSNSSPDCLKP